MSNVYWDSMMFIYYIEETPGYFQQVSSILDRMRERDDTLCASMLTQAELLVKPYRIVDAEAERKIQWLFDSGLVNILPFDVTAARKFAQIRAANKVAPADAIHLACASAAGVDLFLTNDLGVRKLLVSGIQFIDGLNTTVLGN